MISGRLTDSAQSSNLYSLRTGRISRLYFTCTIAAQHLPSRSIMSCWTTPIFQFRHVSLSSAIRTTSPSFKEFGRDFQTSLVNPELDVSILSSKGRSWRTATFFSSKFIREVQFPFFFLEVSLGWQQDLLRVQRDRNTTIRIR